MKRGNCKTCKYWHELPPGAVGECRIRAPVLFNGALPKKKPKDINWNDWITTATVFPVVAKHAWCGEYD